MLSVISIGFTAKTALQKLPVDDLHLKVGSDREHRWQEYVRFQLRNVCERLGIWHPSMVSGPGYFLPVLLLLINMPRGMLPNYSWLVPCRGNAVAVFNVHQELRLQP